MPFWRKSVSSLDCTLVVAEQYFTTAFFVLTGLIASGCGDTASVNPVVELASLTVDPGTLQPAFSGGNTQYTVDLSNNTTSVTITAQPAVAGDTVTINGQATTSSVIQLGTTGTTTPVSIVVSETGTNSRTYTVLLVRAGLTGNNSLQNLAVTPGTLAPTFDPNLQTYTVDVANNVGSVTVTPTLSDPAATMTVNGQVTGSGQARTVPLNGGAQSQSTTIPISVTAQNGTSKSYLVTVNRGVSSNNNLQSLTVSSGTLDPTFNANRTSTSYTVNVASGVTSITVTPRLQDSTASMTVNGQPTNSGQAQTIQLSATGSSPPIFIVVTAQNGTQKTYTVGITRAALGGNNNLSGLSVSQGTLNPAFRANTTSYTANVASSVTSVTLTPRLQDSAASMTVNGQTTDSGQTQTIQLGAEDSNTPILIIVTAQNGTQKTYSVGVNRAAPGENNNLSALTVSPGTLNRTFNANRTSYTVDVASTVTSVMVTAVPQDTNAGMEVNGQGTGSGQAREISLGAEGSSTNIAIRVNPPTGNAKTYTITVERAAQGGNNNLQSLTVTPGALTPAFTPARTRFTVNVGSSVTSVTVTAIPQDTNAGMEVNGQGTGSGQSREITLEAEGSSTNIAIRVNPPTGNAKTYRVAVNRASSGNNGGNGNEDEEEDDD